MTRSSTKELLTPFKEPEQEFQSSRKLFKTLHLDEPRSPLDLFHDLEKNFKEEVAETMVETMEQYMSKTRADYGSGIDMSKIDDKDHFELKGKFLMELRDNTFSGLDHEDANEHIEKVLEIVDLFYVLNITQDQIILRVFPIKYFPPARTAKKMEEINNFQQELDETVYQAWERFKELLMKCPQHYLTEMQEVILFYNGLDVPTRQILDSKGAIPTKATADAKIAIKKWLNILKNGTMEHLGQEVLKLLTDWLQFKHNSTILEEKSRRSLPSSTETNPKDHVKSISTTVEADITPIRHIGSSQYAVSAQQNSKLMLESGRTTIPFPSRLNDYYCDEKKDRMEHRTVKYLKGIAENVLVRIGKFVFPVDFIILDMPKDVKVPLILERPFLSIAYAKIDLFKRKITLRVRDEKIIFKSMKPASSLIKRVYMLGLRERMELDLEARLMRETLVLNRSLDSSYGDYIKLNDLNVPLELRRDQVDDLMPTIKEGEVINEPMIDIIKTRNNESFDEYPSLCDFDRKIHIDYAYNLRFSCMIGFKHVNANFFPILSVNMMSREFYNSITKDKVEYKGQNIVGAFMNVPIFVGKFSFVTHFAVVENMDGYRDQDMGDVIVGEPFCKASYVEARRFDGIITIHNGNDNVTYQMAQSHPRFKHLSIAQCNKIKPLLKVSIHDKLNGVSHPHQKLKSFYKEVLNLGPEYIQDAKMEEWLTYGHVSPYDIFQFMDTAYWFLV
ncbi:homeodomain-like protein [Tanacetum coccineum]